LLIGFVLALAAFSPFSLRPAYSPPPAGGMSRSQQKGNMHTRGNLRDNVEVPLEAPPPPPKEDVDVPEHRVPYTLHIVSHFPNNKHLGEESNARKFIEEKIVNSFMNMEDMIRHVEVNLQVSENFKRSKPSKSSRQVMTDDEDYLVEDSKDVENPGHKMISPYIFKVTVTLTNKKTIVLANAEKHAQPTMTEGLDHMVDVIKKSLREEKEKAIQAARKDKSAMDDGINEMESADAEAERLTEEIEAEGDRKAEELYRKVEAKSD